ncbi:serine/arginine-rich splicing factor 3-like [Gigantopelta aegis]|uniref:serine/arginine-rich splicing factor 3-like n=1 Tax=Gigantopelta aegis TaxID=1735272 RepID=UPI001B888BF6|nr:serine/arginine-rich splicing factor 3-like [Gigantopelta aegis]
MRFWFLSGFHWKSLYTLAVWHIAIEAEEVLNYKTLCIIIKMSRNVRDWRLDCKVYVGDLGYGAAKQELEERFGKYGPLRNVWVARKPPGFAFVEFEDPRDAEDATRALDGQRVNGRRVRVEMSSGKSRWGSRGPPPTRVGGRYDDDKKVRRGRSRSFSPRRRSASPRRRSRSDSGSPRRRSRSR